MTRVLAIPILTRSKSMPSVQLDIQPLHLYWELGIMIEIIYCSTLVNELFLSSLLAAPTETNALLILELLIVQKLSTCTEFNYLCFGYSDQPASIFVLVDPSFASLFAVKFKYRLMYWTCNSSLEYVDSSRCESKLCAGFLINILRTRFL